MKNLIESDKAILKLIIGLSKEAWFFEGEDCPDPDMIVTLENAEVKNSNLQALVLLAASGPGLTDVHAPSFTPIAELLEEGESEEEIWESNREYFSEERKQFLAKFK
jgi:general stress protein 26